MDKMEGSNAPVEAQEQQHNEPDLNQDLEQQLDQEEKKLEQEHESDVLNSEGGHDQSQDQDQSDLKVSKEEEADTTPEKETACDKLTPESEKGQTSTNQASEGVNDEASEAPKVEANPNQCEEVRKMFVGGLSPETTEEELKEHFEKLGGPIVDHCIIRKDGTDNKRLFGFVTFADADHMDEVFAKRPIQLNGRTLEVKHAIPKGNTHPGASLRTKKLFIANLGPNTAEDEIRTYLESKYPSKYGTVETIQLLKKQDKKDENRGCGFIFVSSEDFADKIAIQEKRCEIGGRIIEIKKSEPKDERGGGNTGRSGSGAPASGGGYGYGPPPQQPGYYGHSGYGGYGSYYDPYGYSYQGYGYGGYGGAPGYGGRQYRGGYGGRQRFSPY